MSNYTSKFEKRVTVTTHKPTAETLMALLEEHHYSTDTELSEWTVDIESKLNDVTHNMLPPAPKYRWEITLTRSIK